jgi:nucleoside-diphosphate-sugar epimerase
VVYYLAPPPGGGVIDPRVRVLTDAIAEGNEPQKIIYMSTSGVYGDCGGALVDEETPAAPGTPRGKRRLDAEQWFLGWGKKRNVPVVILRVSAIYGPGRLPIPHIESGNPVLRESDSPLSNRIHADDLATVCLAAGERGEGGEIFNVSDGECTSMTHYFNAVADAFGLLRPPQVTRVEAGRVMNPLLLSYFSESRCLDNTRMRERLKVTLRYPNLHEGLNGSKVEGE